MGQKQAITPTFAFLIMKTTQINKTFLIILLGVLAALGPFSIDMYLPGFSQIAAAMGTDEHQVAFTLTSYFIGISIGQLIYGPVVDKYGRKKPLLAGLFIYILAALGCAFSQTIDSMIAMRFLQALGGCVGMVASNAIISDVYEKEKMAKAFSLIMLVMGVAPLIAPSIGSMLLEKANWSFIFLFLAAFAALVSLLIYFFLPETNRFISTGKLRISEVRQNYWTVLQNRTFLLYTITGSLSMAILFAYITSSSFVFQTFYGLDKATFSVIFAINAAGLITGSSLNGLATKKVYFLKIAAIATRVLCIVITVLLAVLLTVPMVDYRVLVAGIFSILFLTGFINPNVMAASLSPFKHNAGVASALGGALRMGAGALVAAAIGTFQGDTPNTLFITIFVLAFLSVILLRLAPALDFSKSV